MVAPTASPIRQNAIETARRVLADRPVYLDTETTGLGNDAEIIEVAIVDDDGHTIFQSLVKPRKPIPPDASAVHGLYDADVAGARAWPIVWNELKLSGVLKNRPVVIYNAPYDLRLLQQSLTVYDSKARITERINAVDLLVLYSRFRGEPGRRPGEYRYFSLDAAGKAFGISLPNAHRAVADTLLTRAVLHAIANSA